MNADKVFIKCERPSFFFLFSFPAKCLQTPYMFCVSCPPPDARLNQLFSPPLPKWKAVLGTATSHTSVGPTTARPAPGVNELSVSQVLHLGSCQVTATRTHHVPLNFPLPLSDALVLGKDVIYTKGCQHMDLDTQTVSRAGLIEPK